MLVAFVTIRWPASGRLPIVGPIHAGLARKPAGHRTTVLDDDYWSRWLAAVALRPDLPRLVKMYADMQRRGLAHGCCVQVPQNVLRTRSWGCGGSAYSAKSG
jgi:hypothetical protein